MMHSDSIIIGVDGGGTACKAALRFGSTAVRFDLRSGPANVSDFDPAISVICETITALVANADLHLGDLKRASVHLGLAGVTGPVMADRVAQAICATLPIGKIAVTGDQPTMVAGALGHRDGVVAAIGTGSFIARQNAAGLRSLGGWGFLLGDQASGAWLGQRLLQEVMLIHDAMAPTTDLGRTVLAGFNNDPAEVVAFAVAARPADFADFARPVLEAATKNDALAARLMRQGAGYISDAIEALQWTGTEAVCLTGGLGPHYAVWLPDRIARAVTAPIGDALDGALSLAERLATGRGGA